MFRRISLVLGLTVLLSTATVASTGPAAESNRIAIARIRWTQGGGWFTGPDAWNHDYPVNEANLLRQLQEHTTIDVVRDIDRAVDGGIVELADSRLHEYAFAYLCEVQDVVFTPEEVDGLREYLTRGGFLLVDDARGEEGLRHFAGELKKVFPTKTLQPLTTDHPLFHSFYDIDEYQKIPAGTPFGTIFYPGEPLCYGLSDDRGRVIVMVNWNTDISDGWENAANPIYPREYAVAAYKLGINIAVYAMTH